MDWASVGKQIFEALLPVLIPAIVGALIAWGKLQLAKAAAARPNLMGELQWIAQAAVAAAEQAGAKGAIQSKKNYALNVTQRWLDAKGIKLDTHLIDAAIETAVWTEINKNKEPGSKPTGFIAGGVG